MPHTPADTPCRLSSTAVKNINATNKKVCVEVVGYLLEELRDAGNFENFKKDIGQANIFIGSLIFIEELADKVSADSVRDIHLTT